MTNKEILDSFLGRRGLGRGGTSMKSLMPFFLMDCVFQIYDKQIRPLKLRPHSDPWKRREQWHRAYNEFNENFLAGSTIDEQVAMADKLDSLQEYLRNDLAMMQAMAWRHLQRLQPEKDGEAQDVGAYCFLAEILCCIAYAQSERIMDGARSFSKGATMIVVPRPKELTDTYKGIDAVRLRVNAFNNAYYRPTVNVNLSLSKELDPSLVQLLSHINKFIKEDYLEDAKNYTNEESHE